MKLRPIAFLYGCSALLLSACSSPADQAPVDLKPGFYRVTSHVTSITDHTGKTLKDENSEDLICIGADRASNFPNNPLYEIMPKGGLECSPSNIKRAGNQIEGTRNCTGSADGRAANMKMRYSGSLTEKGFELSGQVETEVSKLTGEKQTKAGNFKIRGERVDDCKAG